MHSIRTSVLEIFYEDSGRFNHVQYLAVPGLTTSRFSLSSVGRFHRCEGHRRYQPVLLDSLSLVGHDVLRPLDGLRSICPCRLSPSATRTCMTPAPPAPSWSSAASGCSSLAGC